MKKTKLWLLWILTLSAVPALPSRAAALDAGTTYDVYAHIEDDDHWMGTWRFRPTDTPVDGACRCQVEWTSRTTIPLSAEFYLDEQQTPSRTSCAENASASFLTILSLAPDLTAMGFDRFAQRMIIHNMILLSDGLRGFLGTMQIADGIPYAITAQPASGTHRDPGDLVDTPGKGGKEYP